MSPAARTMLRTTLAIPAIHCPSCVEHISSLLDSLSFRIASQTPASEAVVVATSASRPIPTPIKDISVSLIDSTVSFTHPASPQHSFTTSVLDKAYVISLLTQVHDALGADGYTPQGAETRELSPRPNHGVPLSIPWLNSAELLDAAEKTASPPPVLNPSSFSASLSNLKAIVNPFRHETEASRARLEADRRAKWQRHVDACAACREEAQQRSGLTKPDHAQASARQNDGLPASMAEHEQTLNVTLAIGGMTCASCTNAVTAAAQGLNISGQPARVRKFSVELLSDSARAVVATKEDAEALRSAIEDAGYDVTLVSSTETSKSAHRPKQAPDRAPSSIPSTWAATFAVGGMTCASCVGNVNGVVRAAMSDQLLIDFTVSLLENGASATICANSAEEAQSMAKQICQAIEDAGYDAELADLRPEAATDGDAAGERGLRRSARIRVEGMFCNHCVAKVRQHLSAQAEQRGHAFGIEQDDINALSLSRPFMSITYLPSPSLTLRSIIKDLQDLDPAFSVHHVPAPSLASRSAKLARKELVDYIIRLATACLFVPPTLVLGVIAPMLTPEHPLRHALDRPVWGGASLGEVMLWLLATPVQFGVGSLFYSRSIKSFRSVWKSGRSWTERLLRWGNMEVLVALGTSISYFASLAFLLVNVARGASTASGESMTFFDTSVFLIAFILLGRVLEAWSKRKTGDSVAALGALRPSKGLLVSSPGDENGGVGSVEEVDVELLEVGDLVLVPTGSSPPLDSTLVVTSAASPTALLDESSLTGESVPASKSSGDQLYAGTVNVSSHPITARVTAIVGDQLLDGILDVVRSASSRKASLERIADRVTSMFVPLIVYTAVIVLCTWLALLQYVLSPTWIQSMVPHSEEPGAKFIFALRFAISFVVVACPCGIGLAAPTAQMAGIGLASKFGILANGGGEAFQSASRAGTRRTVVVFDKTGTLTEGIGQVVDSVTPLADSPVNEETLWAALDITEQNSSHPLADALRAHCVTQQGQLTVSKARLKLRDMQELSGKGLHARFAWTTEDANHSFEIYVGNKRLLADAGCDTLSKDLRSTIEQWQAKAWSPVFVAIRSGKAVAVRAILAVADPIRTEAKDLITWLVQQGAEPWIVSGDAEPVAQAVGAQIGVQPERIVAGVLPAGKEETIRRIQDDGGEVVKARSPGSRKGGLCGLSRSKGPQAPVVFFVGDGINDAPALTAADVGIAMGGGSAIASTSADFILLSPNAPLSSIPSLLSLSRATTSKVLQNFVWAAAFNLTLLPTAAGALMPLGFELPPSLSGLAMAVSSTSVVLNALTLRLWRPPRALKPTEATPLLHPDS